MDNNEQLINELSLLRKAAERIADALEDIEESLEEIIYSDDEFNQILAALDEEDFEEFDDFDDDDEFDDDNEEEKGDEEE